MYLFCFTYSPTDPIIIAAVGLSSLCLRQGDEGAFKDGFEFALQAFAAIEHRQKRFVFTVVERTDLAQIGHAVPKVVNGLMRIAIVGHNGGIEGESKVGAIVVAYANGYLCFEDIADRVFVRISTMHRLVYAAML